MKSNTLVLAVMPYNFSLCRPRGSDLASEWRELPGREDQYQPRRRHRPAQEGLWVILCCDTQLFFFVCFRISYHVPPPYLRGPFRRYGTIQFRSLVKYIWSMISVYNSDGGTTGLKEAQIASKLKSTPTQGPKKSGHENTAMLTCRGGWF